MPQQAPYEGVSTDLNTPGIQGENDITSNDPSNLGGTGVLGLSTSGRGVWGQSDKGLATVGDSATGTGVLGASQRGIGVEGRSNTNLNGSDGQTGIGVIGTALSGGRGVVGVTDTHTGVEGNCATGMAVYGKATNGGRGVVGESDTHTGVEGHSTSGAGIWGQGSPAGHFEGNVEVTGDVILTGADCAEGFDVAKAAEIEPGTVMVLDQDGKLQQCCQAYDKKVAGVVSGAGDYRPGLILDRKQPQDDRMPVALVGKVYCKVDAQYAPIEVGDLLTTSLTLGHAMKADDPHKAFGTVIGKALRGLPSGQGLVPILVALQ